MCVCSSLFCFIYKHAQFVVVNISSCHIQIAVVHDQTNQYKVIQGNTNTSMMHIHSKYKFEVNLYVFNFETSHFSSRARLIAFTKYFFCTSTYILVSDEIVYLCTYLRNMRKLINIFLFNDNNGLLRLNDIPSA